MLYANWITISVRVERNIKSVLKMLLLSYLWNVTTTHIYFYQLGVRTSINLGSFQSFFILDLFVAPEIISISAQSNVAQFTEKNVNVLQIRAAFVLKMQISVIMKLICNSCRIERGSLPCSSTSKDMYYDVKPVKWSFSRL